MDYVLQYTREKFDAQWALRATMRTPLYRNARDDSRLLMQLIKTYAWVSWGYTSPEACLIEELGVEPNKARALCSKARHDGFVDTGFTVQILEGAEEQVQDESCRPEHSCTA